VANKAGQEEGRRVPTFDGGGKEGRAGGGERKRKRNCSISYSVWHVDTNNWPT